MKLNLIREKLQESIQNKFRNMSEIFNAGGREKNNGFKFTKESWKNKKYEIHYEIQYNKKSDAFYIRIDCHFIPYSESKNLTKEEYKSRYGEDEIIKRLEFMKGISKAVSCETDRIVYRNRWQYNALWCVMWDLSGCKDLDEAKNVILSIVSNTEPIIDNALNKLT